MTEVKKCVLHPKVCSSPPGSDLPVTCCFSHLPGLPSHCLWEIKEWLCNRWWELSIGLNTPAKPWRTFPLEHYKTNLNSVLSTFMLTMDWRTWRVCVCNLEVFMAGPDGVQCVVWIECSPRRQEAGSPQSVDRRVLVPSESEAPWRAEDC